MTLTIRSINIHAEAHRLIKPYVLSFGTIDQLYSIQAEIKMSDGSSRKAETVPLPGYSDETKESIEAYLHAATPGLIGKTEEEGRNIIARDLSENPFACSPLLTALDLFHYNYPLPDPNAIDFVVPASATDPDGLRRILSSQPKTVKIKLSGDAETDIACVGCMETVRNENTFFRFDANKAFAYPDAQKFYTRLASSAILTQVHYVEQPLEVNDWEASGKLIAGFPAVKTMLDESIVTMSDLRKAISLRVPFVKFKLFKQGGIRELLEQIELAIANGIKVVLGNGVATKMSNDIENAIYLLYKDKLFGASEANGFLKIG